MEKVDFLAQACAQSRQELLEQKLISEETPCLSLPQIEALHQYLDLLQRWSKKVDLVSPGDEKTLIKRHIIDSYAAALLLDVHAQGADKTGILDVGSGAGLPGFVLAISLPERPILLCEPRAKRCVFLKEVVRALGLSKVSVHEKRMEDLSAEAVSSAGMSVCRALGKSKDFVSHTFRLLGSESVAAEMHGPSWDAEEQRRELRGVADLKDISSYELSIPESSRSISFWCSAAG